MKTRDQHYLQEELYALVREDPQIFEFLQEGSLDGVWYWDLTQPENEWMSPRFWRVFGHDPATKDHKASEWQDMIHPDDLATALANFEAHCADPSHPYDQLVRYTHKDGSTVWVRCRGLAIRDDDGVPIRLLGAHNDVTDLKRAEAELSASNQRLERFAYLASHDLQEPLRTMRGFAELLAERLQGRLDAEESRWMEHVLAAGGRMKEMISGLLAFSRVERVSPNLQRVDLDTVLDSVLDDLGTLLREEGAEVVREGPLGEVLGDARLLRQVFANLLSNSVRFSGDAPPRITVRSADHPSGRAVTVSDEGIGFDDAQAERAFALFGRLHPVGSYPGSGMGLAIVRQIVEGHGGSISVETAPGAGAAFTLTLPTRGAADG